MSKEEELAREAILARLQGEGTVGELIESTRSGVGVSTVSAARALHSLMQEGRLSITDPSPPSSTAQYLLSPYSLWFWGLMASVALTVVSVYLLPPSPPFVYARYVFGALFVLFVPGYSLIEALYPKRGDLDGLERLALSIGLSLALVPLVGLVLNYTPWGIRLDPIVVSLVGVTLVLSLVSSVRKAGYMKLLGQSSRAGG
jgi:hypothetical protein